MLLAFKTRKGAEDYPSVCTALCNKLKSVLTEASLASCTLSASNYTRQVRSGLEHPTCIKNNYAGSCVYTQTYTDVLWQEQGQLCRVFDVEFLQRTHGHLVEVR